MNIKVQCCGLVLVTLLAVIHGVRKKLDLTSSKVFVQCLYACTFCLVMDILSLFGIAYRDYFLGVFGVIPILICKTYLVSLVAVAMLATVYVATGVSYYLPSHKRVIRECIAFSAVITVLIYVLPITLVEIPGQNLAWTEGPSCIATYFGVMMMIAANLVQIYRNKQYIYVRQRRTVIIWMCMWIAAAVIQALNAHLLIVGYACALGVAIVYVQFESPELSLDRNTGLFNYAAFARYCEELYSGNKEFQVIAVVFDFDAWKDAEDNTEIRQIYEALHKVTEATGFKIMENEVLLFFTRKERARGVWGQFQQQMQGQQADLVRKYLSFYYLEEPRCVSNYGEMLELLQYAILREAKPGSFYAVEDNLVEQMFSERRMTQQIMEALEEDRVVVYYQPIFSVDEKRFTSAEALVRIVDRDGQLIPPGAFIRIAENTGLINELGKRVFEKVCQFYQQSRLEEYGLDYVEINLSVVQCSDETLADKYVGIINKLHMDPHRINLEITESASLATKGTLLKNMERLMDYGIHFSLDDFGTGASNLNYIVEMPVKLVKFDRGMILAYFASGKAKYVMDAAMHMIHGMGLKMVAEGIETEEQFRKMEEIKINYIQGYYFSKPLPEQEFLEFLERENGKEQAS